MRRPSLVLATALVLQTAAFWSAGCAARGGSPVRVDGAALTAGLAAEVAACPDAQAVRVLLARDVVEYAALLDVLREERTALRRTAALAAEAADSGAAVPGHAVEELNRCFSAASDTTRQVAATAARHDAWRHRGAPHADPVLRVLGSALSAAAALELYDSYLDCGALLTTHPAVRKIIDRGDAGFGVRGGQLDGLTRDYLDLAARYRTHDTLRFLAANRAILERDDDPHLTWLRERLTSSPSGRTLGESWLVPLSEFVGESVNLIRSDLKRLGDASLGGASKGFGNAVGVVQFRRGKLHGDRAAAEALRATLRPGDILLEKTPFRLTDRFIPGHWGHAAIWLGTADEVRDLLGEDPLLGRHLPRLAAGAGVCEALRDGVQLNPVERFLDVDDVCVLRCPDLAPRDLAEHLRRCLRQLGKSYDFNFDVETADRIVCSELVYQVYTGIAWPTGTTLGRWTISPDQVANRARPGGPLTVVDLWHDGRRLDGDLQARLTTLLDGAR
jgi:uncharacterized protein YycO